MAVKQGLELPPRRCDLSHLDLEQNPGTDEVNEIPVNRVLDRFAPDTGTTLFNCAMEQALVQRSDHGPAPYGRSGRPCLGPVARLDHGRTGCDVARFANRQRRTGTRRVHQPEHGRAHAGTADTV